MSKIIRFVGVFAILSMGIGFYFYFHYFVKPVIILEEESVSFYLPTGSSTSDLFNKLKEEGSILQTSTLENLAKWKGMKSPRPGHYRLHPKMNANQLINTFQGGLQTPVKLIITPSRLPEDLAGKIGRFIELDSLRALEMLKSDSIALSYGFETKNFYTLFLPDTYEVYWNLSSSSLLKRMKSEYEGFWNESRMQKAKALNLTPDEVIVLASIVYAEQLKHPDERARIAGLYLNRLRKKMPLQSDPTLVYAKGDFSIQRVLSKDREIDSPYNTYKYAGLPPGPIYLPDKSSIDAVLNAEKNKYLYMCARPDDSGYHLFTASYTQHLRNAKKYQNYLNRQGIYR
jgi:UPF0755 protein